jgi:hypothetical protein
MKLHIFESTYRDIPCWKAVGIINRSKKLGITKRIQKTWRAVGEHHISLHEVEMAFRANAKRWEARTLELLKAGKSPDLRQEEIVMPAQTATPGAAHPPPSSASASQSSEPTPSNTTALRACE